MPSPAPSSTALAGPRTSMRNLLPCRVARLESRLGVRLFQGFAAGLWPMDLAIMTLYAPPQKLGVCLGIMQGVLTAGGVIGPLLGGILAEVFGMRVSFFLAAGALLLNFFIFAFFIKEPPAPAAAAPAAEETTEEAINLWSIPLLRNMMLCGTLVQMVILILQPVLTTYIAHLAGPLPNIAFIAGLVFSLGGIAGAMAAPFWGSFGQRLHLAPDPTAALIAINHARHQSNDHDGPLHGRHRLNDRSSRYR